MSRFFLIMREKSKTKNCVLNYKRVGENNIFDLFTFQLSFELDKKNEDFF